MKTMNKELTNAELLDLALAAQALLTHDYWMDLVTHALDGDRLTEDQAEDMEANLRSAIVKLKVED